MKDEIWVSDLMPAFVNTPLVHDKDFVAPIVERLGVDLIAEDVALAAWQAVSTYRVHHPVGLSFKALMLVNKFAPAKITRRMMAFLSR